MAVTRWGILGAAKFARQHMGPAIHAANGAELAALATRSPEKASEFQRFAPSIAVQSSYEELLADPLIDAVYIPLPNDMHTPWALKAIEAGKHVLIEKPVAMSLAELDALIAARDASGLFVAEAFMIVHHPQWHKMRELFRVGTLGDLRRVHGVFTYDSSGDPGNIRHQAARGGGSVPDIGVYPYGAARFVTGQEPISIDFANVKRESGVDTTTSINATFEGFEFSATTSMRMMRWQQMEFHGTKAVARLTAPFNPLSYGEAVLELHHEDGRQERFVWPELNQYVLQVEAFQRAIAGGSFDCPLEFSRGTQAMIEQVLS